MRRSRVWTARAVMAASIAAITTTITSGCEKKETPKAPIDTSARATSSATTAKKEEAPKSYDFGARDLNSLVKGAEAAIKQNDPEFYGKLFAPETIIASVCAGAFPDPASQKKLGRTYMRVKAKLPEAVKACHEVTDWSSAVRIGAEGGALSATPPGCKDTVQRYMDVHVFYQQGKEIYRIILKNPVTFDGGETWVLDREPSCGRFVLALEKETLSEEVARAMMAGEEEALARLALTDRLLESSCEERPLELIQGLRSLSREPARARSVRECLERIGWKEGDPMPTFSYSEPTMIQGCRDALTRTQVTARIEGKEQAMTFTALRYDGGIGKRWHLAETPRCAID